MIGYIYQIENLVTHESYIGQTIDFKRRKRDHINNLKNNQHDNPKLQNAWNKYGEQEFHFRAWEFNIESSEELNKLECEYIKKFNSLLPNGYNADLGGIEYHKHSEDIRKKISEKGKQLCFDPIQNKPCTLNALRCRKRRNKELYKDVAPTQCIIEN